MDQDKEMDEDFTFLSHGCTLCFTLCTASPMAGYYEYDSQLVVCAVFVKCSMYAPCYDILVTNLITFLQPNLSNSSFLST